MILTEPAVSSFCAPLIGLPVSHIWRGRGSALVLEFGELGTGRTSNPEGEMGLMIEWGWRIEGRRSILCGAWSEERIWPRALSLLLGARVRETRFFGRFPEIAIGFDNDVRLASFMIAEGDTQWALFDKRSGPHRWLRSRKGRLEIEVAAG